jgi:thiol peroxidase
MKILKFQGNDVNICEQQIAVGEIAPDFTVTGNEFNEVKLSDYKGKTVVITVFPSIDTSVCALQAKRFNQEASQIGQDVVIMTVSVDLPPALGRFCGGEGIDNLITTSDYKSKDFALKYGFLVDELQLLARGTVIIDKDGIVQYVEYVEEITSEPDYTTTLESLSALR